MPVETPDMSKTFGDRIVADQNCLGGFEVRGETIEIGCVTL